MTHTLDYAKKPPNYCNYKIRAKKKFPMEEFLTEHEFEELVQKDCFYCGKIGPNGIDRVNNKLGYSKNNCVPCCKHCNYVKGDLTINDFQTWTKRFVANNFTMT